MNPEEIKDVKVKLNFEIGRTRKELGEILNFGKGTYIKLEESKKGIIQVRLNDKKIGNGELITMKGELFVQLTEGLLKK